MPPARFRPSGRDRKRWTGHPAVTPPKPPPPYQPLHVLLASSSVSRHHAAAGACIARVHRLIDCRAVKPTFHWAAIDPDSRTWTPKDLLQRRDDPALTAHRDAVRAAAATADALVVVVPSGVSTFALAGRLHAGGLPTAVYAPSPQDFRPEQACLDFDAFLLRPKDLLAWLERLALQGHATKETA